MIRGGSPLAGKRAGTTKPEAFVAFAALFCAAALPAAAQEFDRELVYDGGEHPWVGTVPWVYYNWGGNIGGLYHFGNETSTMGGISEETWRYIFREDHQGTVKILHTVSPGEIVVEISGEDSGTAIGYRGEALDAIQLLTRTYLNQEKLGTGKVVVDCENYRAKRRETLVALAGRLAEKAYRTRRKVALEPMNPFERRIIHSALIDSEIAETHSEGEDSARHVVIVPKGVELREDRRRDNRRDGRGKDRRRDGDRPANRRNGDDRRRERTPRMEEEVPDGNEYRGYFTDGFVKSDPVKTGPPKFKSFGGKKKF